MVSRKERVWIRDVYIRQQYSTLDRREVVEGEWVRGRGSAAEGNIIGILFPASL